MPLPRDAAPNADSDRRGTGGHDHLVALAPGCRAPLRRSARRPDLTDGGAGRRVLDLGCRTGASTAVPTAAFPGAGSPRTGGARDGGARADGTRPRRACGGGTR